jgi:uroporphyrinogen decarboxylase
MDCRETVYAQLAHQETPSVPYTLLFEGNVEQELDGHYGSHEWRGRLTDSILRLPSPVGPAVDTTVATWTDPYGSTWRTDRRPYHLWQPALPSPRIEGLHLPDVDSLFAADWRRRAEAFVQAHRDRFVVVGLGFGLFERSWTLRGFEQALMDSVADPEFYDSLLERLAAHQLRILERLVELSVDGIMFSDDWGYQQGTLLGPASWRRFLKPRLKRMYALVHEAGKIALSHCCGSIVDVLPDVVEIGLDVLESVQPEAMDPYALKRLYGRQITFWGGLGSQSTIQFGRPREIREEIARLCEHMGRGGGYILSPAKPLQPGTPVENAAAVVEAFVRQGTA